ELRSQISALSERLENIQLTPGPRGEQGPQGLPGQDGQDGKSAYQIAVDNGFVGGEKEWLDSLKVPSESQAVVKVLRHAPTGYAISEPLSDDAGEYYQVYFDNGCILQLRKSLRIPVQETGGVLGIGQAAALEASTTTLAAAPLTYAIIRTACRSVQLNTWKTSNGVAQWYRDGYIVLNPVNDVAIYDWSNAKYNPADTLTVSLDNQQYLIRTFYALGIWGDATVESFGAVRL
ncbi:TPA: collagen-like protein, partial [Streptococcus suis]